MDHNDDEDNENLAETPFGSDELLASDELRLPASANILVRLHALRAWLNRRRAEAESEIGTAALALQQAMSEPTMETRPRRRFAQDTASPVPHAQHMLQEAQQSSSAYEEANTLLEDCVAHLTTGERVLVEYYLALEELVQAADAPTAAPWLIALAAVRHRVEQVGTPGEEDV
ncbi:MAG: hypothetical protein ACRDHZ_03350 [Ktedonobacteraceae bacterium]